MITYDPVPNDVAAKIIRDKSPVSKKVWKLLLPELRARAFLVSGIEDAITLQNIRDIIAELPEGASWEECKAKILAEMSPWLNGKSAEKRAALLLRHHGFAAYAAADYRVKMEVVDSLPYWQYLSMADEKVRDSHAALHGLVLRYDDPFWQDHYPPWDWNCRCMVAALTAEEEQDIRAAGRIAGQFNPSPANRAKGWVLPEGAPLKALHDGTLDMGDGHPVNIKPPSQKPGGSYQWHPGDLRISVDELRNKYSEEVFSLFVEQAKLMPLANGLSVWDWLADGLRVANPRVRGGALLPKKTQTPKETPFDKSVREISASIEREKHEVFCLIDSSGNELCPRHHSGKSGGIIPAPMLKVISGNHLIHNHPSGVNIPERKGFGSSFSLTDILTAAGNNVASIRAVSPRRTYVMKPGKNGWPSKEKIRTAYKQAIREVGTLLIMEEMLGRPQWQRNAIGAHLIWKKVAKRLKINYTFVKMR